MELEVPAAVVEDAKAEGNITDVLGAFGSKDAIDVPLAIQSYDSRDISARIARPVRTLGSTPR